MWRLSQPSAPCLAVPRAHCPPIQQALSLSVPTSHGTSIHVIGMSASRSADTLIRLHSSVESFASTLQGCIAGATKEEGNHQQSQLFTILQGVEVRLDFHKIGCGCFVHPLKA